LRIEFDLVGDVAAVPFFAVLGSVRKARRNAPILSFGRKYIKFYHQEKPMHLNIKNDEAHKLAAELAKLTGESLTSAVTLALRERLARERRRRRTDHIAARLMKIGSRFAAFADTGRSPEEILGYDEHGSPT
jgi:antitoxin VapB